MKLFENNTYSVVNIFDVTLRPQLNVTGVVEVILNKLINPIVVSLTCIEFETDVNETKRTCS